MRTLSFTAGDVLWRAGEPGGDALLIEDGVVDMLDAHAPDAGALATFGPGHVLGEMALIDDRPRTHTARARSAGQATTLSRDEFEQAFVSESKKCLPFVLALCARLRRLEARPPAVMPAAGGAVRPQDGRRLCLWPLSRHTARLLPAEGLLIDKFPFRLGRPEEADENPPPSLNDLWLLDKVPFLVSRNHLTVLLVDGARYVVQDRGSHLGTIVNERKIGGTSPFKEVELEDGDNVIILGHASSPFKFRAAVECVQI